MASTPITHFIPAGTTEPQAFQALADGAVTDLTGISISLDVTDKNNQAVVLTGAVALSDPETGKWTYTPDGQLVEALSPYSVRVSLTDGSNVYKVPNGRDPDVWLVVHP